MQEKVKRLTPTPETVRELFLKSGNLCVFPNCGRLMMNADGVFIGQVCHIEAAEEGGERFNPEMTNELRRAPANLMLMCYDHHHITNDVAKYSVETLRRYKEDHERRFSHPDRAILEQLRDWTTSENPRKVANLKRMNDLLGWKLDEGQLQQSAETLNDYLEKFGRVPVPVRRFLGVVSMRIRRVSGTRAVSRGFMESGAKILVSDLRAALRISESRVLDLANQLDSYGLGSVDEIQTDLGEAPAVKIRNVNGWCLWDDIAEFCEKAPEPIEAFTVELDFGRLDL